MRRGRHNPQSTVHNPQSTIRSPSQTRKCSGAAAEIQPQISHILYAVNPKPREMRLLGGQKEAAATRAALGQGMEQPTTKLSRKRQS